MDGIKEAKLTDGTIVFRLKVNYYDSNGNRKQYTDSVKVRDYGGYRIAKEAAKQRLAEMQRETSTNTVITKKYTLNDLFGMIPDILNPSQGTMRGYNHPYNVGIKPKYGNRAIETIRTSDVQESLTDYAKMHTDGEVSRLKTVWSKLYFIAGQLELPIPDKTKYVKMPKSKIPTKKRETRISKEDFINFLYVLPAFGTATSKHTNTMIYYACIIMYFTGLRPQEVYALSWSDIDMFNCTISVNKRVGTTSDAKRQLITVKTKKAQAKLPFSKALLPYLEDLKRISKTDPILANVDGLPYSADSIATSVTIRSEWASEYFGIGKFTQYMVRHLFATENKALPPSTLQQLMRHETPEMSQKYINTDFDVLQDAVANRQLNIKFEEKTEEKMN